MLVLCRLTFPIDAFRPTGFVDTVSLVEQASHCLFEWRSRGVHWLVTMLPVHACMRARMLDPSLTSRVWCMQLYLDEELRIGKGDKGTVFITRRVS